MALSVTKKQNAKRFNPGRGGDGRLRIANTFQWRMPSPDDLHIVGRSRSSFRCPPIHLLVLTQK